MKTKAKDNNIKVPTDKDIWSAPQNLAQIEKKFKRKHPGSEPGWTAKHHGHGLILILTTKHTHRAHLPYPTVVVLSESVLIALSESDDSEGEKDVNEESMEMGRVMIHKEVPKAAKKPKKATVPAKAANPVSTKSKQTNVFPSYTPPVEDGGVVLQEGDTAFICVFVSPTCKLVQGSEKPTPEQLEVISGVCLIHVSNPLT